jgi:hypothetical protein
MVKKLSVGRLFNIYIPKISFFLILSLALNPFEKSRAIFNAP